MMTCLSSSNFTLLPIIHYNLMTDSQLIHPNICTHKNWEHFSRWKHLECLYVLVQCWLSIGLTPFWATWKYSLAEAWKQYQYQTLVSRNRVTLLWPWCPNEVVLQFEQYIILKDGILRFNSCNITCKRGVYFTVHSLGSIQTYYKWD